MLDNFLKLPEWLRHIGESIFWLFLGTVAFGGVVGGLKLAFLMAFSAEIRDQVEHITKPTCHPEGFNLYDLFWRLILPIICLIICLIGWLLL